MLLILNIKLVITFIIKAALEQMVNQQSSQYRNGALEGIVIRRDSTDWCESRAKLVRADFTQTIDTHWRKRAIEWNRAIDQTNNKTYHNGKL